MGDERQQCMDPASVALAALADCQPRLVQLDGAPALPAPARGRIIDVTSTPGQGARPWGEPVRMPVGSQDSIDDDARADSDPGWGRREVISFSDNPQQLARISLRRSIPLTVAVDVLSAPPLATLAAGGTQVLSVWANVEYGAGSASAKRAVRCDYRQDIAITGCWATVSVYLGDSTGAPVAGNVYTNATALTAQVAVMCGRGVRAVGAAGLSSTFVEADGATGVVLTAPARVLGLTAQLSSVAAGQRWLVVGDASSIPPGPAPLINPVASYALGTLPVPGISISFPRPRAFGAGLVFVVSSTAGTSSPPTPAAESVHVEIEQLQV
jgi:hypothetical protein